MKLLLTAIFRRWTAMVCPWSVVGTLAVDAGATASLGVQLRAELAAGNVLTKRYTESINLQLTSRTGTFFIEEKTKPPATIDLTENERWTDTRTVAFTDSCRITDHHRLIARRFVEVVGRAELSTSDPLTTQARRSETSDSALPWNALELIPRDGGLELIGRPGRGGIDAPTLELACSPLDFAAFLCRDEVNVGARWDVPASAVWELVRAGALVKYPEATLPDYPWHGTDDTPKGTVAVETRAVGLPEDAAAVLLPFTFEIWMSDSLPESPSTLNIPFVGLTPGEERVWRTATLSGGGQLLWDAAGNLCRELSLTAEIYVSTRQEQTANEMLVRVELLSEWRGALSIVYTAVPAEAATDGLDKDR
jgi:hypothetical protein